MSVHLVLSRVHNAFGVLKAYSAPAIWAVLGSFSPVLWVHAVLLAASTVHFVYLVSGTLVRRTAPTPVGAKPEREEEAPHVGGGINSSIAASMAGSHAH